MKHNDGLLAAGFAVGRQQRAQFAQQRIGRWQDVAGGAGRTGSRALPATGADMRVDDDVIPGWRDRACWAEIEAPMAAHDLRS